MNYSYNRLSPTPSPVPTDQVLPPIIRLEGYLNTPSLFRAEIDSVLEECSSKDLQVLFPNLIERMFGVSNQLDWGLRTILRSTNPKEFEYYTYFLSPLGPLFRIIYKLTADSYIKYDFPLVLLPSNTASTLAEGIIPSYYTNKVQVHPHTRMIIGLSLNPFEYYFFHYAKYLLNHISVVNGNLKDMVYFAVLIEYLNYFLPCNGYGVPPLPFYVPMSPPHSHYVPSESNSYGSSTSLRARTPVLLRPSVLVKQSPLQGQIQSTMHQGSPMETWRSEVVAQTFAEFWLNHGEREHKHSGFSPKEMFVPSSDHVRTVRLLVKHFHYFANGPASLTSLDDLKQQVSQIIQKKMYKFFCHIFDHWPFDASFRVVLETWLSYIQPWRYTNIMDANSDNEEQQRVVDPRWQTFILENMLFYSVLLNRLLIRFLRLDLSTPANSQMLYRITRVFSQPNLTRLLLSGENSLQDSRVGNFSNFSFSPGSSSMSDSVGTQVKYTVMARQKISELESSSYVYQTLFGTEMKMLANQLLLNVQQAKISTNNQQSAGNSASTSNDTFLKRCLRSILDDTALSSDGDISKDDMKKVGLYLESATVQLCSIFELPLPEPILPSMELPSTSQGSLNLSGNNSSPERVMTPNGLVLTPKGRRQLLNGQCKFSPVFDGDPDLQLITSFESRFLVRMLYNLSSAINEKYEVEMQNLYHSPDFQGRLARHILMPPATCYAYDPATSTKRKKILPARLSLRFLANHRNIFKIFVLYAVGYFWGFGIVSFTFFLMLCVAAFYSLCAFVDPLIHHTPPQ